MSNYIDLINNFVPRIIRNEEQYKEVRDLVYKLVDEGIKDTDTEDYLSLLCLLVEQYESLNVVLPDVSGVDMIKCLMTENNLKQKDLVDVFKTESIVSAVLNGKRKLTVEHIERLSKKFNTSPSVFF